MINTPMDNDNERKPYQSWAEHIAQWDLWIEEWSREIEEGLVPEQDVEETRKLIARCQKYRWQSYQEWMAPEIFYDRIASIHKRVEDRLERLHASNPSLHNVLHHGVTLE